MTRPYNETLVDRMNEETVIKQYCQALEIDEYKKNPVALSLDYSLIRGGRITAMAEVKCRPATTKNQFKTYFISFHKLQAALLFSEFGIGSVLIVRWEDVIGFCPLTRRVVTHVAWGGNGRGQEGDKEPMAHIPISRFRDLA